MEILEQHRNSYRSKDQCLNIITALKTLTAKSVLRNFILYWFNTNDVNRVSTCGKQISKYAALLADMQDKVIFQASTIPNTLNPLNRPNILTFPPGSSCGRRRRLARHVDLLQAPQQQQQQTSCGAFLERRSTIKTTATRRQFQFVLLCVCTTTTTGGQTALEKCTLRLAQQWGVSCFTVFSRIYIASACYWNLFAAIARQQRYEHGTHDATQAATIARIGLFVCLCIFFLATATAATVFCLKLRAWHVVHIS